VALWLFALAVAAAAVAASLVRLHRVRTALRLSPAALARTLGRAGGRERLERLAADARRAGACWEAGLFEDLAEAGSEAERVAVANEHLGDLGARLAWGSRIPVAAARLTVALPLCAAFFALAGQRIVWPSLLPTVLIAAVGAAACLGAGRQSDRTAAGLREGVDLLVEQSLRAAAGETPTGDSQ
jgi:hypothetical protein